MHEKLAELTPNPHGVLSVASLINLERPDIVGYDGFTSSGASARRHYQGEFHMDVKATLLPGANGTKALLREYGDQLVCVRYRYDKKKHKRYKTIEIIVEEKDWVPATISYPEKKYSCGSVTVRPNSGN